MEKLGLRRFLAEPRDGPSTSTGGDATSAFMPLEQVLPFILLGRWLAPSDVLALFAASKYLQHLVLEHQGSVQLSLGLSSTSAPGRSNKSSKASLARASAQLLTSQQLAAQCPNVSLALHGKLLLTPAACLWQRITTMQLHGQHLFVRDAVAIRDQLQLHKMPHLRTLCLQRCSIDVFSRHSGSKHSSQAAGNSSLLLTIHTLQCMQCTPSSSAALSLALMLADPFQLQAIITDDKAATALLNQLPVLREIHILPSSGTVEEDTFQQLLSHPTLRNVTLSGLSLVFQNYADRTCQWDSLQLVNGVVDAHTLAHLPLASIKACKVQHTLRVEDSHSYSLGLDVNVREAIANAARCPNLVFEQTPSQRCLDGKSFSLNLTFCRNGEQAGELITVAMAHLAPGAALEMMHAPVQAPAVFEALAATPMAVTSMCFFDHMQQLPQVVGEHGVLTHLPGHVQHVVLFMCLETSSLEGWFDTLFLFMRGVERPMRLTLVNKSLHKGFTWGLHPPGHWSKAMQARVHEWMAKHANSKVHVEFKRV